MSVSGTRSSTGSDLFGARNGDVRLYRDRDTVANPADAPGLVQVIRRGHVRLALMDEASQEVLIGVATAGDVLYESHLSHRRGRLHLVGMALGPVETVAFDAARLSSLRATDPAVDRVVADGFAQRRRYLERLLFDLVTMPPELRLRHRLRELYDIFNPTGAHGVTIPLPQRDLASLAAASRATVNRILKEAAKAGAVRLRRGALEIIDSTWLPTG